MNKLVPTLAVLVILYRIVAPTITPFDIVGMVVVVPALTFALYRLFTVLDIGAK